MFNSPALSYFLRGCNAEAKNLNRKKRDIFAACRPLLGRDSARLLSGAKDT